MRKRCRVWHAFCCIAMWFIMLTTGVTLNRNGILNIRTAQDAAKHCDRLLASTHIFYLL